MAYYFILDLKVLGNYSHLLLESNRSLFFSNILKILGKKSATIVALNKVYYLPSEEITIIYNYAAVYTFD